MSASDSSAFFYISSGKRYGPVSFSHLRQLAAQDTLQRSDKVWCKGMPDWQEAGVIEDLFTGLPPELQPALNRPLGESKPQTPGAVPGVVRADMAEDHDAIIRASPDNKARRSTRCAEEIRMGNVIVAGAVKSEVGSIRAAAGIENVDPPKRAAYATAAAVLGILSPFGWLVGIMAAVVHGLAADPTGSGVWVFRTIVAVFAIAPPLLAVAAGRAAGRRILESGGTLSGGWQARAGLILGYGTLLLLGVSVVLAVCYVERLDAYFSNPVDEHYP